MVSYAIPFSLSSLACPNLESGSLPVPIYRATQGKVNYLAGALSGLPFSATKIAINLVVTGPLFFPLCTFPGPT